MDIRVSSKDQNVDRQITALKRLDLQGASFILIIRSGKDFNRPHYQKTSSGFKTGRYFIH